MKRASWPSLFANYRGKGLLVDANLLLLYLAGRARVELIAACKPLRAHGFSAKDYSLLSFIIHHFKNRLFTTPHILTEVSNLSTKLHGPMQLAFFRSMAGHVPELNERHTPAARLCAQPAFPQFGLTDAAVIDLAPGKLLVLTMDFKLAGHLETRRADAINFMHLRQRWPGYPFAT